jgi:adenosylcobyric acid synthase
LRGAFPVFKVKAGTGPYLDGARLGNGRVWGTYIHGVFDADGFRRNFLGAARKAKGYARPGRVNFDTDKEFDKLACLVRRNLNMKLLYEIIGSGV